MPRAMPLKSMAAGAVRLRTAILVLALAGLAAPRGAQAQDDQTYGDWQMTCDAVPAGGEQCALVQRVEDADRPGAWLAAYAFRPNDGGGQTLLSVLVPLEVILIKGLGLKIDDGDLVTFDFIRCSLEGCLASIDLDETRIAALRGGSQALFVYYFDESQGVGFPVSLAGFSAGLDALPQ